MKKLWRCKVYKWNYNESVRAQSSELINLKLVIKMGTLGGSGEDKLLNVYSFSLKIATDKVDYY